MEAILQKKYQPTDTIQTSKHNWFMFLLYVYVCIKRILNASLYIHVHSQPGNWWRIARASSEIITNKQTNVADLEVHCIRILLRVTHKQLIANSAVIIGKRDESADAWEIGGNLIIPRTRLGLWVKNEEFFFGTLPALRPRRGD